MSKAYELGLADGAEAVRSSGSTEAPVNGWDGDLINAIGLNGVCRLFGLDADDERGGWSEQGLTALAEYSRGCEAGVTEQAK
jgi:hypothetical protein